MTSWLAVPRVPRRAVASADAGATYDLASVTSSAELAQALRVGAESMSGEYIGDRQAASVAACHRATSLLSGTIGALPVYVKRVDTHERIAAHPVVSLLRRPNEWQSGYQFRALMEQWRLMRGNAVALVTSRDPRVAELIPLHPDRVSIEQLPNLAVVYRYTRNDGRLVEIPSADVLHVRGPSTDGVKGLGVLDVARNTLGVMRATERHAGSVFRNGANIAAVLTHERHLGDDGQKNLRASLDSFRGAGNSFKTLILEEGMQFQPVGMTAKDAEFIETRKLGITEIAMFFGVPPHMLGFTEKQTSYGQGVEQMSIGFVNYTLNPILAEWTGALERTFFPRSSDLEPAFGTARLLRGDIKARAEAARIWIETQVKTVNELRDEEQLEPVAWGDTPRPLPNESLTGPE